MEERFNPTGQRGEALAHMAALLHHKTADTSIVKKAREPPAPSADARTHRASALAERRRRAASAGGYPERVCGRLPARGRGDVARPAVRARAAFEPGARRKRTARVLFVCERTWPPPPPWLQPEMDPPLEHTDVNCAADVALYAAIACADLYATVTTFGSFCMSAYGPVRQPACTATWLSVR